MLSVENYIVEVITGKQNGFFAFVVKIILLLFSCLYQFGVAIRNFAFEMQLLRSEAVDVPVISIGNIVAGGTGKTPVVMQFARSLQKYAKVGIVSRGYRSNAERGRKPIFVSRGQGILCHSIACGDEAYLLAKNLPGAIVVAGKDKTTAAKMAIDVGAEVILIDDGMQHRYLARDHNVVVMDGRDLFGGGFLLPRGFLREPQGALRRATLIVFTHVTSDEHYDELVKRVRKYTNAPCMATTYGEAKVLSKEGDFVDITGKNVAAFCGIAKPEGFIETLEEMQANVVVHYFCRDHEIPSVMEFQKLEKEAMRKSCEMLLCTEKDWVKLSGEYDGKLPCAYVKIFLKIFSGEEKWNAILFDVKIQPGS